MHVSNVQVWIFSFSFLAYSQRILEWPFFGSTHAYARSKKEKKEKKRLILTDIARIFVKYIWNLNSDKIVEHTFLPVKCDDNGN